MTLDDGQERRDAFEAVASLVQLAVGHEDPARLVAAAAAEVRRPLGLAGSAGEPLGHGPDDEEGRRALAMATAAARQRLVAPPGWQIARLSHGSAVLGFLAVGPRDGDGRASRTLLELMPALLTDQLKRGVLLRAQRAAFVRQLVAEGGLASEQARREGAELGLSMASSYWPALLTWRHAAPPAAVVEAVEREARGLVEGGITVTLDGVLVLLHPDGAAGGGAASAWFEAVACHARSLAPSTGAQAIAGRGAVELSELSACIADLRAYLSLPARAQADAAVVTTRQFALDRLLAQRVGPAARREYVEECLGRLVAWDRAHRGALLPVLEAALDFQRHDRAAAACFMHRNTFRHRLRQAARILGDDLEDPDVRLALHVALKLRKLPSTPPPVASWLSSAHTPAPPVAAAVRAGSRRRPA